MPILLHRNSGNNATVIVVKQDPNVTPPVAVNSRRHLPHALERVLQAPAPGSPAGSGTNL